MPNYIELHVKRNRGWPWPEDSWGLTPMYGDDGWCHGCGVPQRPQCGDLVMQRKGFAEVHGAWIPNWRFDALCLAPPIAEAVCSDFDLALRKVRWRPSSPGDASQIVATSFGTAWFDPETLTAAAEARHGTAGKRCAGCDVWRWMPLSFKDCGPMGIDLEAASAVVASPEWFGDGWQAYRIVLVRRDLAELLARESPRDFERP